MIRTGGVASRNGDAAAHAVRGGDDAWEGLAERLPRTRRQRRPALIVVGVLLVALCTVGSASLVARGDDTAAVLALARPVAAGHVLAVSDLRTVKVSGTGVSAIAATAAGSVVGEMAVTSLPPGTLLVSGMLTRSTLPPAGGQVVAVAVKSGLVPAGVAPGRDVSLIAVPAAGGRAAPQASPLVDAARVVEATVDSASGTSVLSVVVPDAAAAAVARASATGGVAVTLLPVGS